MTAPVIHKVFLSSTNADLARYRDAVLAAIDASDHLKCLDYRNWGPRPDTAHDQCRAKVLEAQLFVGLLGPYRGWEVAGDNRRRSITELELDWASEAGMPRFLCVTPDEFPIPAGIRESDEVHGRQQELRRRVMAEGANVVSQDFTSPDRLATVVINSLLGYLLAEEMRRSARNADAAGARDDRAGVREALRQLADDHDADLDALLDDPSSIDGEALEGRLQARAQALLDAQAKAQRQAAAYYRHLGALAFLRNTDKAVEAYREAARLDPECADGWRQLGVLHIRRGDFLDGRASLQRADELARRSGDRALEGRIAGNLGAIELYQNRLTEAERLFARDHAISSELGNRDGLARARGNLGLVYMKLARHEEAYFMHSEALAVARQLGNRLEEARQVGNLAEVKCAQGDIAAAVDLHRQALALDEELGNREGVARHAGNLGELASKAGDDETAERLFEKALAIDEQLRNRAGQARHLANLGNLHSRLGHSARAETLLRRALSLHEELQKWVEAAQCAVALAEVLAAAGAASDAGAVLERSSRYPAWHSGDAALDELRRRADALSQRLAPKSD